MDEKRLQHLTDVSQRNLDMHNERITNAYRAMNNIIFVISTGAFVLTISFIGYLKTSLHSLWILLISWIFLFLTIIFNFFAHYNTARSSSRGHELVNEERIKGFPNGGNFSKTSNEDKKIKKLSRLAKIINICVLTFLPLGIISLLCFSWINLKTQNEINIDKQILK